MSLTARGKYAHWGAMTSQYLLSERNVPRAKLAEGPENGTSPNEQPRRGGWRDGRNTIASTLGEVPVLEN